MGKNFKVTYEEIEDILYLGKEEKVKFSLDLALPSGDIVVDIGSDGKIAGLEVFNATEFFSMLSKELQNIKDAEIKVIYSPSYTSMSINLETKKDLVKSSNLVIPYSKNLAFS
ncbi:MAG: DUF2283 domain-containing protein [Candidatus Pacearchaeota archaeon]|jgi:uncharacterized protein YuzE